MNALLAKAWLQRLARTFARIAGGRGCRHAGRCDPLPAGIQIRLESQGLLYIEPRAAGGEKSGA